MFLFSFTIFIIAISVLVSLYLSKTITRPVLRLSEAANEVASGNLSFPLSMNRGTNWRAL